MTIARDASSPVRFNLSNTTVGGGTESGTSASFTPPANSWVYCSACINSTAGATPTYNNPTNTGGGLGTWAIVKSQTNASGGASAAWRAFVNSSVATTVTVSVTNDGETAGNIANDAAAWVDVWTGAATSQTGAATAGGTSTTVNFSPTVTTTASGSQVAGVAIDWAAAGTPTSTDTIDGYTQTGQTSGGRAYKASNSGAAGSVALNFHSPGTPQWAYVLYEILAPTGGGTTVNLTGQAIASTEGTITQAVSYAVSGQAITSISGTITPSASYGVLGQSITSSIGSIVPAVSYGLTGQTGAFTEGSITATQGGNVTKTLTGQTATFTEGSLSPVMTYSVTGLSLTSTEGSLSVQPSYAITGRTATFTEGTITAVTSGNVTKSLTGLSASFTLGLITAGGGTTAKNVMPNLFGLNLWAAIQSLEDVGIVNTNTLGYFGTWPVSVTWIPPTKGVPYISATATPGIVIGQSIVAGVSVPPNSPILLNVVQYTVGVSYPG